MGIFTSMIALFGFPVYYAAGSIKEDMNNAKRMNKYQKQIISSDYNVIRNNAFNNGLKNNLFFTNTGNGTGDGTITGSDLKFVAYIDGHDHVMLGKFRSDRVTTQWAWEPLFDLTEMEKEGLIAFKYPNQVRNMISHIWKPGTGSYTCYFTDKWTGTDGNYQVPVGGVYDKNNAIYYKLLSGLYTYNGMIVKKGKYKGDDVLYRYPITINEIYNSGSRVVCNLSQLYREGILDNDLRHYKKGVKHE